jgi:hypothetical protein
MTKPVDRPRKRPGPKPEPPELRLLKGRGNGRDSGGRLVVPKPTRSGHDGDPDDGNADLYDCFYLPAGQRRGCDRWPHRHADD